MKTLPILLLSLCAGTTLLGQTSKLCPVGALCRIEGGHIVVMTPHLHCDSEGGEPVNCVITPGGSVTEAVRGLYDALKRDAPAQTKPETEKAASPIDVPPISEEYGNLGWNMCDMGCVFVEADKPPFPDTVLHRRTRLTCAEKTRFLMTAEDGSKHCIALLPDPKKK